jgi:hypothetical protein
MGRAETCPCAAGATRSSFETAFDQVHRIARRKGDRRATTSEPRSRTRAPAGNQTVSKTKTAETFFLSNIALKKAQKFYQSIWVALEDHTGDWVFDNRITEARRLPAYFSMTQKKTMQAPRMA